MAELGSGYEDREQASFFSLLPTPPALLGGIELLTEASALAIRLGADAQAVAIDGIIGSVERNVAEIGVETAKVADRAIVDRIRVTRVRPEVSAFGYMLPGKRLDEGVKSEVLGLGAVGIASIEELESVVGTDGRPFWRTQEYGSSHNVGRVVIGVFQPGGSAPDQQDFRKHPIFEPGGGAGAMHIQRPIPARHFLRDGAAVAALYRERTFREAEIGAITEIKVVRASLI